MSDWDRLQRFMALTGCGWRGLAERLDYTQTSLSRVKKTGKASKKLLKALDAAEREAGIANENEQAKCPTVGHLDDPSKFPPGGNLEDDEMKLRTVRNLNDPAKFKPGLNLEAPSKKEPGSNLDDPAKCNTVLHLGNEPADGKLNPGFNLPEETPYKVPENEPDRVAEKQGSSTLTREQVNVLSDRLSGLEDDMSTIKSLLLKMVDATSAEKKDGKAG